MKIKSYYSRTVEDAMAAARQEMGPDAMLVNSRKAPPEVRHLGEYEVVFANVGAAVAPAEAALRLPGERAEATSIPQPLLSDRLSAEVADLKKELEGMRHAITRTAYAPAQWIGVTQDLSDAYAMLTSAELSSELARGHSCRESREPQRDPGRWMCVAGQEIIAWNSQALPLKSPPGFLGKQENQDQLAKALAADIDQRKQWHSGFPPVTQTQGPFAGEGDFKPGVVRFPARQ